MADSTATLREGLQHLPQELYDNIYDLTFCALERAMWPSTDERVVVNGAYHTPKILHIDQQRRTQNARDCYSVARFWLSNEELDDKFLESLGWKQRSLLKRDMRLDLNTEISNRNHATRMRAVVKAMKFKYGKPVSPIVWFAGPGPQYLEFRLYHS